MKVEFEIKPKHQRYADIPQASCFYFSGNSEPGTHEKRLIWMRLSGPKNDHAVNLSTGELRKFETQAPCIPADMKVVPA